MRREIPSRLWRSPRKQAKVDRILDSEVPGLWLAGTNTVEMARYCTAMYYEPISESDAANALARWRDGVQLHQLEAA